MSSTHERILVLLTENHEFERQEPSSDNNDLGVSIAEEGKKY
jgi:hypothetical protein